MKAEEIYNWISVSTIEAESLCFKRGRVISISLVRLWKAFFQIRNWRDASGDSQRNEV